MSDEEMKKAAGVSDETAEQAEAGASDAEESVSGADDAGASAQFRAVALLHGREEGVHVDVEDRPGLRGGGHGGREGGAG